MTALLLGAAGLWSRLAALFTAALSGVTGFVTRNPQLALTLAFAFACGVLIWRTDRLAEQRNQARADQAQAETALKTEQASNTRLTAAIAQQNAAVAKLGTDSAAAVAQGNAALSAAATRSTARAAQSARIVVPVGGVTQADCRTPDAVMAAKGGL